MRNRSKQRRRPKKTTALSATIDKAKAGFAFFIFDDREYEDTFIPKRLASTFFAGDRVRVKIDFDSGEILDVELIEHRYQELVGIYSPYHTVYFERKKTKEEIPVQKKGISAKPGDWVRIKLHFRSHGGPTGEILENYGKELPASADLKMIAGEFGLEDEHPKEVVQEAQKIITQSSHPPPQNRKDLTKIPFITIDGATARDFDDAVFVEKENHGFTLWVAIADVSYYVKEGQEIDREAKKRGNSTYFPEKAFHMLPKELSENLCSLVPNVPRLALSAKIGFTPDGKRKKVEFFESVIQSRRRATYDEIQNEYEAYLKGPSKHPDWEYRSHFELFHILKKSRIQRGTLDFELPEADVRVNSKGEPESIEINQRKDAHRLIEEFMIAANEAVANWMLKKGKPFVYRIHEVPSQEALEKFKTLAKTTGIQIGSISGSSFEIAKILKQMKGHTAEYLLNLSLLRSMRQAIYTAGHDLHFGLASPAYTHFTSPIRRYPDLIVHRLIKDALSSKAKAKHHHKELEEKLEQELEKDCHHCNYRERLSAEAEREAIRLKRVRYMKKHLGDVFQGKITGMNTKGLFVEIQSPFIEGMVPKNLIGDDHYQFNEDRMVYYGSRTKTTYKIGDGVQIQIVRADIQQRQIDFQLV